ncbi:MAG: discoidin domain-containing protein, partial [Phycisphaerae bacterium]
KDLAYHAQVSASSNAGGRSSKENAADDNLQTYWSAAKGNTTGAWLALRLSHPQKVEHAYIVAFSGNVGKFKLQCHRAGHWLDISAGNLTGRKALWLTFAPLTAQRFRVLIETTPRHTPPALREIELLP